MVLRGAPRGVATLFAGEVAGRTLSFVAIWLVVSRIGADAYAPVAVALSVLVVASLVAELGLPLIGAREIARERRALASLTAPIVWAQVGAAAALCAFMFAAGLSGLVAPALGTLLAGYGLSLLLTPFMTPWVFQGLGAMSWIAGVGVARQVVFLAFVVAFVRGPGNVSALPLAEIAAVGIAGIVAQVGLRRKLGAFPFLSPARPARAWLAEGMSINAAQLLWVARMYLVILMLWDAVPPASVSRFDIAHRIMLVLHALVTTYMTGVYPEIVRATAAPARLASLIRRSMLWSTGVCIGGAAVVSALAPAVLSALMPVSVATGETYACTAVLAAVMPVAAVRGHARLVLLALGRARWELLCSIAGSVLVPAFVAYGISVGGAIGAAGGLAAAETAGAAIAFVCMTAAVRRCAAGSPAAPQEAPI